MICSFRQVLQGVCLADPDGVNAAIGHRLRDMVTFYTELMALLVDRALREDTEQQLLDGVRLV